MQVRVLLAPRTTGSKVGTVEGWGRDVLTSAAATAATKRGESDLPPPSLVGLGASARTEMLERLPYLFAINLSRPRGVDLPLPRAEMEKVVRFVGL